MSVRASLSALVRGRASQTIEQRNARNLVLSSAWLGFIDGGIMTYLSVWLARMGATPGQMSLLSSGPQLVNMVALLPASAFAERQTDLVRLANRSALITRSGYLLIALLPLIMPSAAIPAAIIIWSLFAIPSAVFLPAFMSVIQRAVPPQMRPQTNANRWALYSTVGAIAIPCIGIMIDRVGFPQGYQLAFIISFVGTLPNLYFFGKIVLPPFKPDRPHAEAQRGLRTRLDQFVRPFFEHRRFVRFNAATAVFRICLAMPVGLFSIYWVDYLHASNTLIGIRGAVGYVALVFAYGLWGRVVHRIGHRSLLYLSALIGLYAITTALAPSAAWLLPVAIIWGVCVAAIDIGLVDMLLLACPEGRQPTFIGMANVLGSAELFIGPLIGAALAQAIGVPAALVVSGVLQILSGVFFVLLPSRADEQREHAAHAAGVES
jgi:MFS family permease